ncbi:signal peptidase II, partial [Listeria monocytogenes]|nr:signal peptidase II [Listeria monocytogenes]
IYALVDDVAKGKQGESNGKAN